MRAMLCAMWFGVIAACGTAPPPPAQPVTQPVAIVADAAVADAAALDQDLPRLVERLIAMYQDIAGAFTASGVDCAAATARLGQLASSHREVVMATARVERDGKRELLRAALEPRSAAFDEAARAVMQAPALGKCATDPAFTRAFDAVFDPPAAPHS